MIGKFILPIPKSLSEVDGLRYGGIVTWLTGLTFSVTGAGYYLNGNPFISPFSIVTLDAADINDARIDVIAVDNTGSVVVVKGTPSANPQKPSIDPASQIELTFVTIPANATEPGGITDEIIYDENIEWTPSVSGIIVDFDSNTSPFNGLKCADAGIIGTGDMITFTAAAAKNVADYETLSLFLKLKAAMTKQHFLRVQFLLAGVPVSEIQLLMPDTGIVDEWQNIALPLSGFSFTGNTFDAVRFDWIKQGAQTDHDGFYLDLVKLQAGVVQPIAGEQGPPGEDGLSAYEIAVQNGFVGTEAEWLASLVGADGAPGADGQDGTNGTDGADGLSINWQGTYSAATAYVVNDAVEYNGSSYICIAPTTGNDPTNATYWNLMAQKGADGSGGTGSDTPELHLDFEEAGDEFVYNVPYKMKFTSQSSESSDATLSTALNTTLNRFDKLTITATAAGLVSLYGEYVS